MFESSIADSFVSGQYDPVVLARLGKPDLVGDASLEALSVPNYDGACIAQRGGNRVAIERLVEKDSERFRRP